MEEAISALKKTTPLVDAIIFGMLEKKAVNLTVVNLTKINGAAANYFVICTGTSNTHVESIAESIEEEVRKNQGEKPWHVEGKGNSEWMLLDYTNVVAHVFLEETRDFYALEELWGDAEIQYLTTETDNI